MSGANRDALGDGKLFIELLPAMDETDENWLALVGISFYWCLVLHHCQVPANESSEHPLPQDPTSIYFGLLLVVSYIRSPSAGHCSLPAVIVAHTCALHGRVSQPLGEHTRYVGSVMLPLLTIIQCAAACMPPLWDDPASLQSSGELPAVGILHEHHARWL